MQWRVFYDGHRDPFALSLTVVYRFCFSESCHTWIKKKNQFLCMGKRTMTFFQVPYVSVWQSRSNAPKRRVIFKICDIKLHPGCQWMWSVLDLCFVKPRGEIIEVSWRKQSTSTTINQLINQSTNQPPSHLNNRATDQPTNIQTNCSNKEVNACIGN